MALNRSAYRRLSDLYTVGTELVLLDGTVVWLQAMNPFERDEATRDASAAKSRLVLSVKDNPDSEERAQVKAMLVEEGRDVSIMAVLEAKKVELFLQVSDELRSEDEWREKVDLLQRTPDLATVESAEEREYLMATQDAYTLEVARRLESSVEFEREELNNLSDEDLYDRMLDWWLGQRGWAVAMAEYRLTEIWYAARACDGIEQPDGTWDHSACEGHAVRVFESKDEVKHLPEALQAALIAGLQSMEISEREAKN